MDETMGAALRPAVVESGWLLVYPLGPGLLALFLMSRERRP